MQTKKFKPGDRVGYTDDFGNSIESTVATHVEVKDVEASYLNKFPMDREIVWAHWRDAERITYIDRIHRVVLVRAAKVKRVLPDWL